MTKSLTEQWREGTLEEVDYYILCDNGDVIIDYYYKQHWNWMLDSESVKEVLDKVPSYEEYEKLKKQLEIATKALKDILNDGDDYWDKDKAQEALKEMEGVK